MNNEEEPNVTFEEITEMLQQTEAGRTQLEIAALKALVKKQQGLIKELQDLMPPDKLG